MLCAGPHRLSFNNGRAGERRRPQLKRDPLGGASMSRFLGHCECESYRFSL